MSDEQTSATSVYPDEVTPDSMMNDFRGRPVVGILSFTVIVHVVLISVFSFGYMKNELFGEDTSSMSEDERLKVAVQEATTSLREIAERHGLSPQDLTTQFAGRDARLPRETFEPVLKAIAEAGGIIEAVGEKP